MIENNWKRRKYRGMFEKDGAWYLDYYVSGKRIRERIGTDKRLAEIVLKKRKVEVAEGKFLHKKAKVNFFDLCDNYLKNYSKLNKRSYDTDRWFIKRFKEHFGNIYIDQFNALLIEKYKSTRRATVEPSSINRELVVLRSMIYRAIEWGMIDRNPVGRFKLFKVDNQKLRFLSQEEIKSLLDNCSGYLRDIVLVALTTGMRRGEILNMKWDDIDLVNGTIHIPAINSKNSTSREVLINSLLMKVFSNMKRHPESLYVFCHSDGKRFLETKRSYLTALQKACIKNVTFHTLRHTFCSQLALAGVDIYTIKELAGHKKIEMTMRYAHLTPNHKRVALEALNGKIVPVDATDTLTDTPNYGNIIREQKALYLSSINKEFWV
ncbi:MAG: hypothetical protein A3J83_08840 [Elusimicrobia bacterium RIFOXYA2_FULL_40_6]|nr:MAG: hypothetical protein A3J83_08840 [Elusimicrobia bacterium RIFOXYA2_FULL_40_6]